MESVELDRLTIFLCHASHDKPFVRTLYRRLLEEGFEPWLDEERLLAGQDWQSEIRRAVKFSDVVIVCLSQHSINKAGFYQREIAFALDAAGEQPESAIFLIPARIEKCNIPESMMHLQSPMVFEQKGYENLLSALRVRATSLGKESSRKANFPSSTSAVYDSYFREAFIETFWSQDQLRLKQAGSFTVSLVGEAGCGKTSTAYVLAAAHFNFLGEPYTEEKGYCYLLPLVDNVYIADHYSWEDGYWGETLSYIKGRSDLVLFMSNPSMSLDLQFERLSQVRDVTNAPVVLVINKIDTLVGVSLSSLVSMVQNATGRTPLPIAAAGGSGIENLRRFIFKSRQMYLSA